MNEFSKLEGFLQEYIYKNGWNKLNDIQNKTINLIFNTDFNILISSSTSSGKTEAAFFPIISKIKGEKGINVIYIAPLKALINDQFERLENILENSNIEVNRWHGDVLQNKKNKIINNPSGILQITPESLESLLMNRDISNLFFNVKYIIIDEVHTFIGADRGNQLICQITRIKNICKCNFRVIGLSATLGDFEGAILWIESINNKKTILLNDNSDRKIKLAVDIFRINDDIVNEEGKEKIYKQYYQSIYNICSKYKSIIFVNSRKDAEETAVMLKKEKDIFYVHHGSISKILRQETENIIKNCDEPITVIATVTLELGIDIGDLDRIIQIGAPPSCSSFVQRLGRSGRKSKIAKMYFTNIEKYSNEINKIPWGLLQTIAIIELYTKYKWIEPIEKKPLSYTLLYQQILSILYSFNELTIQELAKNIFAIPVFKNISKDDFIILLKHMIKINHIQVTEEKTLIIGLKAEKIVNHYSFYAIFSDDEEYKVYYKNREIGTVNKLLSEGAGIGLSGKKWKVIEVKKNKIFVEPSKNYSLKLWNGEKKKIHTSVVKYMKKILFFENTLYSYLLPRAIECLKEARIYVNKNIKSEFIEVSKNLYLFIPWLGTFEMDTLESIFNAEETKEILKIYTVSRPDEYSFLIYSDFILNDFKNNTKKYILSIENLENIIKKIPFEDKYDKFLPDELRKKQYIYNHMKLKEVKEFFKNIE